MKDLSSFISVAFELSTKKVHISLDVDKSTSGHYVNAFQMIVILKSLSKLQYRSAFHLILSLFLK